MEYTCILIKPSSDKCNMRCKYCFYADIASKHEEKYGFMTNETAENLIIKSLAFTSRQITYMFQGGEPTLVGLDFYKFFVECANKNNKKNIKIHYAIQTNGYALDEEWAKFFHDNKFLVGLSVDGTKELHDLYRIDASGNGTFNRIIKCANMLEKNEVDFNILTVVTNALARRPEAVYNFYKKQGWKYLQFIPCLNPIDETQEKFDYTLTPERYGQFMIRIFDLWVRDVKEGNAPSIRQFENYIMMLRGMPPESCGFSGICTMQNVIEADGSVYPCDFYVLDELKLGNININSFDELNKKRKELQFIESSAKKPDECKSCEYFPICRNGCKRYCEPIVDGTPQKNFLCKAYKEFFKHSVPTLYRLSMY